MAYLIYKHTNKINNKSYIGLTKRTVKARWGKFGEYYKQCSKFWNAIQKYGWENFEHSILETDIKTLSEANSLEQYYIEHYNTIKNGYNISRGGFDKSYCNIEIYQLDNTKQIIATFESAAEAERLLTIDRGSISKCCKNKQISAGGYYWCYAQEYNIYNIKQKSNRFSRDTAVEQLDKNSRAVINTFKSISEAARFLKKTCGKHIGECCKGRRKTAYGYKWRYKNEERTRKN